VTFSKLLLSHMLNARNLHFVCWAEEYYCTSRYKIAP